MQRAADQRPARRARLAAVLAAVVALLVLPLLLSGPAQAQTDPCPILDPDCIVSTTTTEDVTTTTEEPEETSTTVRTTTTRAEVTTSTLTVTTLHDVLIPGDGSAGAESTTTTDPAVASGDSGVSDESLIMAVVVALGLVAVMVAVLTWRYWHATRPRVVETPPARTSRSALLD